MDLPQRYDPKEAEARWNQYWIDQGIYTFDPNSDKPVFSIDTPPPTMSGAMHLGHAFSYTQTDFIARYKRMRGFNVFYPFGTDDNGLATERMVEKVKKVKGTRMDRGEFIALCNSYVDDFREKFVQDWKNLGISCDWDAFYSTISDYVRKLSQKAFLDLIKQGRAYQKEAPTIWCPQCQTALAQVELEDKEFDSSFNDIIFKVDGKDLIIATTRPELLGSCVAVFAHPDDDRYKQYFDKEAQVPLFNLKVPIKADDRVDPEKGTGIVMCCTFGDQTDIEWYKAFNLPLQMTIGKDGKMLPEAGKYEGMSIKDARKQILEDLKDAGLLVNQKKISHAVNVHERCGTEIEILNSQQWFIRYLDLKEDFLKRGDELKWYPKHMQHRLTNWIQGLQWDWCISRQRFFGIPIPLWYTESGEVIQPTEDQLPVDPLKDKPNGYTGTEQLIPDKDVLDTWATSSLTPQICRGLYEGTPAYDKLFPMSLRPQAHDIISFWLFNTLVRSHLSDNVLPWENAAISGWALDKHGKKMSKSKGNAIDPQQMMEKYSSDAVRFWAACAKLGDDVAFQEKDMVTGKKTANKLFNAAKFAIMNLEGYDGSFDTTKLTTIDRWILSKLQHIVQWSTETLDCFEYNRTKLEVEKFFWQVFCDNYLEIVKDRFFNTELHGEDAKKSAQYTLHTVLGTVVKLFAPILPFVTEEVYHMYFAQQEGLKSIHQAPWPEYDNSFVHEDAEKAGDALVEVLAVARKAKSQKGVSLKADIACLTIAADESLFIPVLADLKAASRAQKVEFVTPAEDKTWEERVQVQFPEQ